MSLGDFIVFLLAILVAGLLGYLIAARLFPIDYPRWLVAAFAPLTGFGICSVIIFFFRRPMFTVEGMLLAVLLFLWFRSRRSVAASFGSWRALGSRRVSLLAMVFVVALGCVAGLSADHIYRTPHGGMDGWAIWDSHARFMYSAGTTWRQGLQNTDHPDYPLLLPGFIVYIWRYIGTNTPDVAGFVGFVFELAGIAVLIATLAKLRRLSVALLMALLLIGSPRYVMHAVSQYADVPLSAYILGTVALLCLYESDESKSIGLIVLAGFMAGCAAWTKNEGLPFILVTALALLAPVFRKPSVTLRRIAGFAAGLAIPLVAIAWFKMKAPSNDLMFSRNSAELLAKLLNPDRYHIIGIAFLKTSWVFGGWVLNPFIPILAFVGLSGVDRAMLRHFGWRAGVAIIAMVLASYFAIYVITPFDLRDHLASSLDRLLMHVWPACLLLVGLMIRNPERSEP